MKKNMEMTSSKKLQPHRYHIHQCLCVKFEYYQYYGYLENIVGAVMSEKGVRCFFRGKSNLKTVLESLRRLLLGIQCCQ